MIQSEIRGNNINEGDSALAILSEKGICTSPEILLVSFPICCYDGMGCRPIKSVIPFGLGILATMAKAQGVDTAILDAEALQLSPQGIADVICVMKPKAVGLSLCSPSVSMVRTVLSKLLHFNAVFFAGGPHVSALGGSCLEQFSRVSAFFVGESECAWRTFLDRLVMNSHAFTPDLFDGINGVITQSYTHCAPANIVENLDDIVEIDRTLFTNDPIDTWKGRAASLLSARSCPFRCNYCSPLGARHTAYRARSITNIVSEIERLVESNVCTIQFGDDTFTAMPSRLRQFCDEVAKRHIDVRWLAYSRVDGLCESSVADMRESGCYKLALGIESANDRILRAMNKRQKVADIEKSVLLCNQYGIKVQGLFMLGYPGETMEEMRNTVQFAIDLGIDDAVFSAVRAYPDTQLYRECVSAGADELALLQYHELAPQVKVPDMTVKQQYARDALETHGIFDIMTAMKYNLVNGVQIGTLDALSLGNIVMDAYVSFYYREEYVKRSLQQRANMLAHLGSRKDAVQ